jgi:hypothetical protein
MGKLNYGCARKGRYPVRNDGLASPAPLAMKEPALKAVTRLIMDARGSEGFSHDFSGTFI